MSSQEWPIPPAELQRRRAKAPYETEMFFRGEELSDFVYDEENDLFRLEGTAGLPSHGPRPILRCWRRETTGRREYGPEQVPGIDETTRREHRD